jgi:hypothetical protein
MIWRLNEFFKNDLRKLESTFQWNIKSSFIIDDQIQIKIIYRLSSKSIDWFDFRKYLLKKIIV